MNWMGFSIASLGNLLRCAYSLSYFISEQPPIWATSALSCLPNSSLLQPNLVLFAKLSIRCVEQPPAAIPASQHHRCFAAQAVPKRFVTASCKTGIAGASRPIDQCNVSIALTMVIRTHQCGASLRSSFCFPDLI